MTHCSAFSQAFFSLGAQWTQKVINDPPFAGLDFGGDIHAQPKRRIVGSSYAVLHQNILRVGDFGTRHC